MIKLFRWAGAEERRSDIDVVLNALALFCLLFLIFIQFGGRIVDSLACREREEAFTDELLYRELKDFVLDDRNAQLTSVSSDPWLVLEMTEDYSNAVVEIEIDSLNESATTCQVFFSNSNTYTEERSITALIEEGTNSISIEGNKWRYLRVDLTNKEDIQIVVSSIRVIAHDSNIAFGVARVIALSITLFAAIRFVIKNYDEVVKKTKALGVWTREHPIIVLCAMVVTTFVACYNSFLFGERYYVYADIGSDTLHQYQAFYQSVIDAIKNNNVSEWTFQYGLGSASYIWTYLLDPMALISVMTGLLFGYESLLISFTWTQGVKILCCALLCYGFLKEYRTSCFSRLVAAYIYAFNGFIICWGQHYAFSTAFVYFTFSFFAVEKVIRNPKKIETYLIFVLAVALQALQTYYFTYMSLLAEGLYALGRLIILYGRKDAITSIIRCGLGLAGAVVLGLGMACTLFLPAVVDILTTSNRITDAANIGNIALWNGFEQNITILCRLLSNNLQGIRNYHGFKNYYEAEQIYYSCFMPVFLPAFVLGGGGKAREKGLRLALVFLIFGALFSNITGTLFNAFVANSGRYTFVLMPVFAIISARGIENILSADVNIRQVAGIAGTYILTILISNLNAWQTKEAIMMALLIVEIVFFLAAASLYVYGRKRNKLLAMIVFVMLIALNVSMDTYLTVNRRTTIDDIQSIGHCEQETESVKKCVASIAELDDTFYRIEKTYDNFTWFNDALIEGYPGISVYNSANNAGVNKFMSVAWRKLLFNSTGAYHLFTRDANNAEMAALLGVKYVISKSAIETTSPYELLFETADGKYIYENTKYTGFARFYSKTICESSFLDLSEDEKQRVLQDTLLVAEEKQLAQISLPEKVAINVYAESGDSLIGSIRTDNMGYVFFPIPNNQGWNAFLDGREVEIVTADYGFMAVKVGEGQHNFELKYERPYAQTGTLISVVTALIFFGLMLTCLARKQKGRR